MQLKTLLAATPVRQVIGSIDRPVENIAYDSRRVQRHTMFVALRGEKTDGHQFIGHAIDRGASVIVTEREQKDPRVTCLVVENTRTALADFSATFYGNPGRKLKLAAVTGTNGKTTTTFLIKDICENAGLRCGLIGTVRYEIGERILPAIHSTMENYFEAKTKLFTGLVGQKQKTKPQAIVNVDDRYGQQLLDKLDKSVAVTTYGMGLRADFRASNYRAEFTGTSYQLDARGKSYLVRLPLIGRFNVTNSIAALAAAEVLGINLRSAVLSLGKAPQVPGRLELVPAKRQFQVFVDYAHTPDALGNVLKTLRELQPHRLIAVFGCGGDRDRQKRPLMAEMADRLADYSIITSDNPRKEDPTAIIAETERGFRSNHYEKIVDRTEAINRAVALARARDIVLVAGKGHENYQEFADYTIPFDDIQVARRAIEDHPVEL